MELKEGDKKTDVGVIPIDWEEKTINHVCTLINGRGFKPHEWRKRGLPIIRIQNLNGSDEFNFYEGTYDKKIEVEKGQLLFAWSGSRGTSFGPHVWNGIKGVLNYHTWKVDVKEEVINKKFFLFALKQLTKHIEDNAHGASALVHTQKWEMEGFKFACPPALSEQKAIAQVLSDTDALIQAIEKKIAKKKLIKKGVMQKMFTPRKGWATKSLPKVCWFQEGPGLRNWQFTSTGIKVINVTNLVNGYLDLSRTDRHISLNEFDRMYKHFEIDEGDIVMASSGNSYSKVSIVRKQDLPLLMNTSVIRFKPLQGLIYNWLLIFLKSNLFKNQIDLLITGGAQPNFGPFHLNKIEISFPIDIKEQEEISQIIIDTDKELEKLEQKLAKYQEVKQGMMQQLLTGKIRLL
ncbi:restriction endonuclease subunit S [Prolixibacteraceae bacterium JC049]|nr:restriction endonuclease subunit S [Prolixibacteraceae bacterium JC049]